MLVSPEKEVCGQCHDDLVDKMAKAPSKHEPVSKGECTKCHNPHKAELPNLLLTTGPDLCLTCHTDLKDKMANEREHAPAGQDCLTCHQAHFAEVKPLLNEPQHQLCAQCHETDDDSFKKAHIGIKAEVMNCVQCHNPHASKDPQFFKDVMHAPFAARTCEPCHVVKQ